MPTHIRSRNPCISDGLFAEAAAGEANGGIINLPDVFLAVHRELTIELTARYRVPTVYQYRYFATSGGLVSYGPDVIDQYTGRRSTSIGFSKVLNRPTCRRRCRPSTSW